MWGIPSALIILGAVMMRDWGRGIFFRAFVFLGNASYSLYLVHTLAFLLLEFMLPDSTHPVTVLFLELFFALAAGIALHVFVERPLLRIKSPGERPPKQPALA